MEKWNIISIDIDGKIGIIFLHLKFPVLFPFWQQPLVICDEFLMSTIGLTLIDRFESDERGLWWDGLVIHGFAGPTNVILYEEMISN